MKSVEPQLTVLSWDVGLMTE